MGQMRLLLKFLPTVEQVGHKLKRMKRGKAPGPDKIVPALLKAGGQMMAKHLCSLFHKVALWASEPLQWKTGILTALFKKGDHKDPANYRSIYISDHMAKIYHGCFRDHLNDLYETQAEDTQMGGRKGKGTDMAHHILQAFQAKAQVDGVCSAIFSWTCTLLFMLCFDNFCSVKDGVTKCCVDCFSIFRWTQPRLMNFVDNRMNMMRPSISILMVWLS